MKTKKLLNLFGHVILAKGVNSFSESLNGSKKQSDLNAPMEKTLPGEGLNTGPKHTLTCFWMPMVGPNDSRHTETIWPIAKRGQFSPTGPATPTEQGHRRNLRQIKYLRHLRGHRLFIFQMPGGRLESGNQIRHVGTGEGLWVFF